MIRVYIILIYIKGSLSIQLMAYLFPIISVLYFLISNWFYCGSYIGRYYTISYYSDINIGKKVGKANSL